MKRFVCAGMLILALVTTAAAQRPVTTLTEVARSKRQGTITSAEFTPTGIMTLGMITLDTLISERTNAAFSVTITAERFDQFEGQWRLIARSDYQFGPGLFGQTGDPDPEPDLSFGVHPDERFRVTLSLPREMNVGYEIRVR